MEHARESRDRPPVPPGFSVREARPADLEAARDLITRVIREDLGYAYNPAWHRDVDDLRGVYLDHPRHALFVAVDDAGGGLLGTSAVRGSRLTAPPSPRWLVARYDPERTAELARVYVDRAHRRRGVARALVAAARGFVVRDGGYTTLSLHTDPRAPGAEPFWRAMPTTLVYDNRGTGDPTETLYFEMALPDGAK
jgi:GNAT superfamily N-acetyltransferase